jgi:hypothetical protein
MTPRIVAGTLGAITLLMGLYGVVSPANVLDVVGFAPQNPTEPALAYGEARAVYGGLFTVLGRSARPSTAIRARSAGSGSRGRPHSARHSCGRPSPGFPGLLMLKFSSVRLPAPGRRG